MIDMEHYVEKLNFSVDLTQLREYYQILHNDYKDYMWKVKDLAEQDEYTAIRVADSLPNYGWAITTEILDETSKSNPPWPEALNDFDYSEKRLKPERKTQLVFGIARKILEKIPYAHHMIMSVFPPNGAVIPHTDQDFLVRIHIPVYTNKDIKWLTETGYHKLHIPGQAYLVDTRKMHAAYNDSKEDRVHFIFAIEDRYLNDIRKINGVIKC